MTLFDSSSHFYAIAITIDVVFCAYEVYAMVKNFKHAETRQKAYGNLFAAVCGLIVAICFGWGMHLDSQEFSGLQTQVSTNAVALTAATNALASATNEVHTLSNDLADTKAQLADTQFKLSHAKELVLPRHLTDEQKARLTQMASDFGKTNIAVESSMNDPEANDFAGDFVDALSKGGWVVGRGEVMGFDNPPPVLIKVKPWPNQLALALATSIGNLKIRVGIETNSSISVPLVLRIGHNIH